MTTPTVTIETITPAKAEAWLALNVSNRPMKRTAIERYAKDMRAGQWDLNGETIKFNGDGHLLDGQNRLAAIVESACPAISVVVRGIEREAQETVDTGVPRRLADVLKLRGETQSGDLAAAITRMWQYERDPYDSRLNEGPSIHAALALYERHPNLRESVTAGNRLRKAIRLKCSVGSALHYILTSIDSDDAEVFFDRLATGSDLSVSDPIHLLREAILSDAANQSLRRRRLSRAYIWALCIKAWNAYREGREMRLLVWRPGGAHPDVYPIPE